MTQDQRTGYENGGYIPQSTRREDVFRRTVIAQATERRRLQRRINLGQKLRHRRPRLGGPIAGLASGPERG